MGRRRRKAAPRAGGVTSGPVVEPWLRRHMDYYARLTSQQNLLEDTARTGTYQWAISRNGEDFTGKVVASTILVGEVIK